MAVKPVRPLIGTDIYLVPPTGEHGAAFIAAARRSRALHRQWISARPQSVASYTSYIARFASDVHYGFLIFDRRTSGLAGAVNLTDVMRGAMQSAFIFYFGFVPYTGRGLMKQALPLVARYSFSTLHLHRLEANIDPRNGASIAIVRACGFTREGLARRFVKIRGRWRDHERWAIIADDLR